MTARASLILHGGAGLISEWKEEDFLSGCAQAFTAGQQILDAGGPALDAVVEAVRILEDLPAFNAGTGSVLTTEGVVEMDACVMKGSLETGAVASIRTVRNPILVARLVMERSTHVLFAGGGADRFAREQGVHIVSPAELITPAALQRWRTVQPLDKYGTVGAVATDALGHVAAATSTGGIFGKLPGRVGDTPIVGAGTYADDELGAASATGVGEAIIRTCLTRHAVELLRTRTPQQAAEAAIALLAAKTGSEAGIIVVSKSGEVGHAFNTRRMCRAYRDEAGKVLSLLER